MIASRGRVIKAGRVAQSAIPIAWEPRSPVEEAPPAKVEVVREGGVVVSIQLTCRCGREHELELMPPATAEEGVRS